MVLGDVVLCLDLVISHRIELVMGLKFAAERRPMSCGDRDPVSQPEHACEELRGVRVRPLRSPKLAPAPPFRLRDCQVGPKGPPSASKPLLTPSCAGPHGNPHGSGGMRCQFFLRASRGAALI